MTGGSERSILIPSSVTMESADMRVRTFKVGLIARAAAVFRMDRIVIYHDDQFDDSLSKIHSTSSHTLRGHNARSRRVQSRIGC